MNNADNAPAVPPDPIYQKSYSTHIALASIALVGAVAYAVADEIWLLRPYKAIQHEYKEATLAYLSTLEQERVSFEEALRLLDDFRALDQAVADAEAASKASVDAAKSAFTELDNEVTVLKEQVKTHRSEIAALTYDAEVAAHHAGDRDAAASEHARPFIEAIAKVNARPLSYEYRGADGSVKKVSGTAGELITRFIDLQEKKGLAQSRVGEAMAPLGAATRARDTWLAENLGSIRQFVQAPRVASRDESGAPAMRPPADEASAVGKKIVEVGVQRYLDEYAVVAPPNVVAGLRKKLEDMPTDPIRGGEIQQFQIHLKDTNNWVDRCEVCHLGARSVVPVAKDTLESAVRAAGWSESRIADANLDLFTSHPRAAELFAKHDPEKVGCSTCHNGNGIAIISTHLAHGENHHWNWPLHPKENLEAGCLQCHQQDIHLTGGPRISAGRKEFYEKGCWGCHPYEGHDAAAAEVKTLEAKLGDLERDRAAKDRRRVTLAEASRALPDTEDEAELARQAEIQTASKTEQARIRELVSQLDTEIRAVQRRLATLRNEGERVGPNLKDLRVAMRPEVITPWVQDPTSVRPDTKMPVFRWWGTAGADGLNEEAKDISAFLWQAALDPAKFPEYRLEEPKGASPGRGRELLRSTGCLSCHAIENDGKKEGNDRAANLSVVGDKKTYAWMFRWLKNPQRRIVPYSVAKQRDLTAAEAAAEDPATLVWRQPTVMPDFRLADADARDIAAYLTSRKSDRKWPEPTWLTDAARATRGRHLVIQSGCAGCHEIAGLESERGIGTDLTKEGSKPLDRLDFGHLTTAAKRGEIPVPGMEAWQTIDGEKPFADMYGTHEGWYRPRGFFMHKLAEPALFDTSRYFTDRNARLRMPKFRFTGQELHDVTTFLLGSVESQIPQKSTYQPDDAGQAIREGWWVLKKYNCQGCHQVETTDRPALWSLLTAEELENRDRLMPPTLFGEGFRVRPEWLAEFLHDPSLGGGAAEPRSVRKHLETRMPTYHFTNDEVAKLVRFFNAMSRQDPVYQPPKFAPLTETEKKAAEAIAHGDAANCFLCHLRGDQAVTTETKGPNLSYAAKRLRPEWMARWIPQPTAMQPWSKMTENFHREPDGDPRGRWVSNGATHATLGPAISAAKGDHVDLMIRWLLEGMPASKK